MLVSMAEREQTRDLSGHKDRNNFRNFQTFSQKFLFSTAFFLCLNISKLQNATCRIVESNVQICRKEHAVLPKRTVGNVGRKHADLSKLSVG